MGSAKKPVIGSVMPVAGMLPKRAPAFACRKPCVADQVGGAQRVPATGLRFDDRSTVVDRMDIIRGFFVEAECGVEVA
ncbi:hypothetical protein ACMAVI_006074 [Burkholderia cenocepacia]|uniref:hypothetical protein n=1 Tax=Burkholderia cepacia complex TaxID=87882 RepID=UPI001908449F|nr:MULTISPECIES: hypothetical protein [Burkholderia cepacia complex]MBK1823487.1 hypothetical protein [Burkholderia orbicola]MBR8379724.1 hypothetical protein [Burkholderia cenocepacia]MBR8398487.1 hypothetical protein [Burkholderia cenocepacia]MDN7559067.1 hypothetical protein [Burkholderia orbicola]